MPTNIPPIHSIPPVVVHQNDQSSPFLFPRPNDDLVKGALIMIIDDDVATVEIIQRYLASAGFTRFIKVSDSSNALDTVVAEQPDIVLLDLIMPVNGVRILEQIRKREDTFRIPVLTLTSNHDETTRSNLLNLGANDFLQKPVHANELVARVRNALSTKIAFDQLAIRSAQLQADVLQDSLTGLANRRAFDFELNRKMIEWERQRTPIALLLIDIDHFKMVNDHFGHQAGDTVLKAVAEIIRKTTRRMDLPCRIGGEEFAVILPVTRICESNQAAERIRSNIEEAFVRTSAATIRVTVSLGVANALKGDDAKLIFRRADSALYASKQRGRNCATLHDGTQGVAIESANTPVEEVCDEKQNSVEVNINASSVMIIDDEPSTVAIVRAFLKQGGFERLSTLTEPTQAFDRILDNRPDLVLLDFRMPGMDGIEILKQMRGSEQTRSIPVIFLTSSTETKVKVDALNLGANDFLHKPVNASELLARVRNTLMAKAHVDLLAGYSAKLEHEVQLRTQQLVASRREAIQCLARAAEIRDDKTGQHVLRVGRYAAIIAKELGFSGEQIVDLEHAAQLHDVGKIGVPDAILNKPDRLTSEEFEAIKDHCCAGSRIIRVDSTSESNSSENQIGGFLDECSSPVMRLAALVAESHHEKWDGTGYPRGLKGEEIPIEGRITAICDVFDAVSTSRPYKKAYPLERCFQIIREGDGTHFDPQVVKAFFHCQAEILDAFQRYSDLANNRS